MAPTVAIETVTITRPIKVSARARRLVVIRRLLNVKLSFMHVFRAAVHVVTRRMYMYRADYRIEHAQPSCVRMHWRVHRRLYV